MPKTTTLPSLISSVKLEGLDLLRDDCSRHSAQKSAVQLFILYWAQKYDFVSTEKMGSNICTCSTDGTEGARIAHAS